MCAALAFTANLLPPHLVVADAGLVKQILFTIFAGAVIGMVNICVLLLVAAPRPCEKFWEWLAKAIASKASSFYLSMMPHDKLVKKFWPNGTDAKSDYKVVVRFPDAPEYAVETLKKIESAGLQPMIALVPGAITIDLPEVKRDLKKEILSWNLDPIIYIKEHDNVAIICHFGNLPNEEKVLEWAKKEGISICFN